MRIAAIATITRSWPGLVLLAILLLAAGCGERGSGQRQLIANIGSDTMLNIAVMWAETYAEVEPGVSVEVSGGGSGQGIAALINNSCDLANSSRRIEEREIEVIKTRMGQAPQEYVVGYDALCVFVHKDNPLDEISMDQLREIYRYGGAITRWSQLGVKVPRAKGDDIILVSRQNNSGTYHYFKETVVGKTHEFRLGSLDMNGSKEVVELISRTPGALGYSGLGYATPEVKTLRVSHHTGEPGVAPSVATVLDGSYLISRPMYMVTVGDPPEHVRRYLDWVLTPAGQEILAATGYVPLPQRAP
jgi:phosphate transport system substrate-binding protein